MTHWSETAQASANASMGAGAVDAPVMDCEDRSWEPLADIEELPEWHAIADIAEISLDDLQDATLANRSPRA